MSAGTVVVGSSVAAVRTVQALRRNGYGERIRVVGEEPHPPYDKPPLSKGLLAGKVSEAPLLTAGQIADLDVDLLLGVAAADLDPARRTLRLGDGSVLEYDTAVIATGAEARPSPWPAPGVHVLRTLADCAALRVDLQRGGPVVVVGGSYVGAEVAATCRALGLEVTVVDPVPLPLARSAGETVARRQVELHHRHGTRTRFGVGVDGIRGAHGDLEVRLADGSSLAASTVVVGIGSSPNDGWLRGSGLTVDDGVVCDADGRTGAPGVLALGDVARWSGRRGEHWTGAVEQAVHVAGVVTGAPAKVHRPSEFVWSDQYDWSLHVNGRPAAGTEHAVVEGPNGGFAVLAADPGGTLIGAAVVNWPRASLTTRKALARPTPAPDVLTHLHTLPPPPRSP